MNKTYVQVLTCTLYSEKQIKFHGGIQKERESDISSGGPAATPLSRRPDRSKGHLQIKEFIADQVCLTLASSCGARGTAYKHQALLHFVSFIIMYIILWEGGWKWVTAQTALWVNVTLWKFSFDSEI